MLTEFIQDGFFAAIAAIGFSAISHPPRRVFPTLALIAATGHSVRYFLMHYSLLEFHIVLATLVAAFIIGVMAVLFSTHSKIPPETYLYPSLLPMIPGMYAYKAVGGMLLCIYNSSEASFRHYFYLFISNGMTCFCILLALAIGATLPIFMLKNISFHSTRPT